MTKKDDITTKKERFFAKGLGKIELADSSYTKEFFEAQRKFATRFKSPPQKSVQLPIVPVIDKPLILYKRRRVFLMFALLLTMVSLLVFVLVGTLPQFSALFIKVEGEVYITALDPIIGGGNKFFGTDKYSEFYTDCLKYAQTAHPLTAISFFFLPFVVLFSAILLVITVVLILVLLVKKPYKDKGLVDKRVRLGTLFAMQLLCVFFIMLSGLLWSGEKLGGFGLFFIGDAPFLYAGIGLFVLLIGAVLTPITYILAYKKIPIKT